MDEIGSFPGRYNRLFFLQNVQMALQPNQPPIQWVLEVKRPGRDADH
jgi:hypothetical protein